MIPFERELYINMLIAHLEEERERKKTQGARQ
jgi:hypothetical protein